MAQKKKQSAEPPRRKPGRRPGKTTGSYNLSLPLDLIDWLRDHPDGPAAVAARALRAEMERERGTK